MYMLEYIHKQEHIFFHHPEVLWFFIIEKSSIHSAHTHMFSPPCNQKQSTASIFFKKKQQQLWYKYIYITKKSINSDKWNRERTFF